MPTSLPLADPAEPEQGGQMTLLQKGPKTRTKTSFEHGSYAIRMTEQGDATVLGKFETVEAATASAIPALQANPKAFFIVVNSEGHVLASEYNREIQQNLGFKREQGIKAVLLLVCSLVPGIVFHLYANQPSFSDTAILVTLIYALCWLFGFTQTVVEAGVIAIFLMTLISLSFPIHDAISKAVRKHLERRGIAPLDQQAVPAKQ